MSSSKKYKVRFNGYLEKTGDYVTCEFAVAQEPGGEEIWKVEVSRPLKTELAHLGIAGVSIAAKAIELHLLGKVPPAGYREDKEKKIRLTTCWYPGHPGKPETIDSFEEFEVNE